MTRDVTSRCPTALGLAQKVVDQPRFVTVKAVQAGRKIDNKAQVTEFPENVAGGEQLARARNRREEDAPRQTRERWINHPDVVCASDGSPMNPADLAKLHKSLWQLPRPTR